MTPQTSTVFGRQGWCLARALTSGPHVGRRATLRGLGLLAAAAVAPAGARRAWAQANQVVITTDGTYRYVRSNGIPDHDPGRFPNANNPNAISAQNHTFRMPLRPARQATPTLTQGRRFGVAVNGVPFDPFTAEYYQGDHNWNYDAVSGGLNLGLDTHGAHVQPDGSYHYHGMPAGLIGSQSPDRHSALIGWAADGYPIYANYGYADPTDAASPIVRMTSGWRVRDGRRNGGPGGSYDGTFFQDWGYVAGAGTLDMANGRQTVTPEFPAGTYAYFLTEEWPVVPRAHVGAPDESFDLGGPGGGGGPPLGQRPPPPGGRPGRPPPRG